MNINDVVIFTEKSKSWNFDDSVGKMYASEGLVEGEKYVVSEVSHGDYSCHIKLFGNNNRWFSTAFFKLEDE